MKEDTGLKKLLHGLIVFLIPFVILMLVIRLLITPTFARVEYRMPGFPEDPFGFTLADRLRWSEPAIKYLVNGEDISFLKVLTFEDGESLFNEKELSHMVDVKKVITGMRVALVVLLVVLGAAIFFYQRRSGFDDLYRAIRTGGMAIVGLVIGILMFVLISFDQLFTWFHKLFFESGTWMFYTSDTLIRLFPMRFWQDAFIFVGALSCVIGVVLVVFFRTRR
jgi:integral membrane protein (TIGR01906 family)